MSIVQLSQTFAVRWLISDSMIGLSDCDIGRRQSPLL